MKQKSIRTKVYPKNMRKIDEIDITEYPDMKYPTIFFILFIISIIYLTFYI